MQKLVIIDGNAIIHRAYHAIPPLTAKDGKMVNAVYGFTSMLLKVWKDLKPEYIAVCFDVAGGTFRHEKFEKYKATRVKADQELYDQIPMVHKVVENFNLPIFEMKGHEADDVIGAIVSSSEVLKKRKTAELEVVIVTGDMDTVQLIAPGVKVLSLRKGLSDTFLYGEKEVIERYGFTPQMMVDYKALRGDTSDNIPGVPGIGEKTATELIQKIGGIKEIYKRLEKDREEMEKEFKPGVIKKLTEGKQSAEMSFELATIEKEIPGFNFDLKKCLASDNFDRVKITELFKELEFVSLLKRLPGQTEETKEVLSKPKNKKESFIFNEIKTKKELKEVFEEIEKNKNFGAKILSANNDIFKKNIAGLILGSQNKFYFVGKELFLETKSLFENEKIEFWGHDLKKTIKTLFLFDFSVKNRLFDVMIAAYLLSPGSRNHEIGQIIFTELGVETQNLSSVQGNLFGADPKNEAKELWLLGQTVENFKKQLEEADNLKLLETLEMPLSLILAEMELNGVAVDTKKLKEMSDFAKQEVEKIKNNIFKMAGCEFNVSSTQQLREVLFEKMKIPVTGIKKGKTGLSTSAEELEKLHGVHPIIEEIENYREITKLQNTYIDVLPTLINPETKRIHTTFNQAVTATGRLSSSDPNLQNIPIRTELGREIRQAFVATEKNILMSADYSQIELRIVASLAQDKKMIDIFERDLDIHKATAAAINNVPIDKVTKEMRRAAKAINFGILYGMGSYGLSWRAEITQYQAKLFIDKYFQQFSGVKKYLDNTIEFVKEKGYAETLFGRRRYIPELLSGNRQLQNAAERMSINHPVQGTAADLMKMAMIAVEKKLKEWPKEKQNKVKMILQVHDELVFELSEDIKEELEQTIKEAMEKVCVLRVPIKVDVNFGKSWGEMK
ncbi:MAG TPA: DNA polymerase I [Candidatus Magasanikbacteria bacterium]|nr:DNA polymerase I [Candidatus Magasanikbacteria bacterium]